MASSIARDVEKNDGDEKTLNKSFEEAFQLYRSLSDYEGETTSKTFQEKLERGIKLTEELTNAVTSLEMFSGNESLEESSTNHLKFLLLPFILGSLWQLKTDKDRHDVCVASQIYFQDFLQRLFDYGIIKSLPTSMEQDETKKKARSLSSDELRAKKIATLKENKLLDSKIKVLINRQNDPDFDDELARELYLSAIQRAHNESVQELAAIEKELELISYSLKLKESKDGGSDSSTTAQKPHTKKPAGGIQTFILTRSDMEKKVFGEGYPALPVMTVEELYAQRRAEGTWGPPPSANAPPPHSEEQQIENEEAITELQEETDDPVRLEQLRRMDEYKDMHRRGWGNRANRS